MKITIEYQETKKPHAWKKAFYAKVLFANKNLILLQTPGSHAVFQHDGQMRFFSYKNDHPTIAKLPRHRRGYQRLAVKNWRIKPSSLVTIQDSVSFH